MQDNIQLTHSDHIHTNKKYPLSIIANDMNSPLNVGSLFRLSDALGIKKLYLCGDTPAPPNGKINKTSRSTEKNIDYEAHKDADALVASLKKSGSFIISLEMTSSSIDICSDEFRSILSNHSKDEKPVCLILGSESSGINETLLSASDVTIHIRMHGNNSSMNVISAASIACFEICRNL